MNVLLKALKVLAALAIATPALAQSTTTYTYDALGRLTNSSVANGPNNGTATTITLDNAGNRTRYQVAGASGGNGSSGGNDGAAVPATRRVIVVPLNGFTIIPIG